jgi:hypothetical protein
MIAIASNQYHTLAVQSNGSVWSWGANSSGQVGNGATASWVTLPTKVVAANGQNDDVGGTKLVYRLRVIRAIFRRGKMILIFIKNAHEKISFLFLSLKPGQADVVKDIFDHGVNQGALRVKFTGDVDEKDLSLFHVLEGDIAERNRLTPATVKQAPRTPKKRGMAMFVTAVPSQRKCTVRADAERPRPTKKTLTNRTGMGLRRHDGYFGGKLMRIRKRL